MKYPICPECGCNTLVGFTPPREGIVGTKDGYDTIGTPAYVDWERAHLYCCNGETNCKFDTRFVDLTTPLTEKKYRYDSNKNPAAISLGSAGGKASARKLTSAQRKARATKASHSRKSPSPKIRSNSKI